MCVSSPPLPCGLWFFREGSVPLEEKMEKALVQYVINPRFLSLCQRPVVKSHVGDEVPVRDVRRPVSLPRRRLRRLLPMAFSWLFVLVTAVFHAIGL